MKLKFALAACALMIAPGAALADADCPAAPKDKWLSEADMKAKATEMGYTAALFKISGNCYEIYGKNKDGKDVEVYFNPVDGSIVKEEVEEGEHKDHK